MGRNLPLFVPCSLAHGPELNFADFYDKMLTIYFHSQHSDARYMARDVQKTIVQICKEKGNLDTDEKANLFVKTLMNKGRYSCDVWS